MDFGAFLYLCEYPLDEWYAYCKSIDCRKAELVLDYPNNPSRSEVKKAVLELNNLDEIVIHAPFVYVDIASIAERFRNDSIREMRETAELANKLNSKIVTIHPGIKSKYSRKFDDAHLKSFAESLKQLDKLCGEQGIRIAVENMPVRPLAFVNDLIHDMASATQVSELVLQHENIGFCLDIGHTKSTNASLELMNLFKERIWDVHLHDSDGVKDHLGIGKGKMDFNKILGQLKKHFCATAFLETSDNTSFEENIAGVRIFKS